MRSATHIATDFLSAGNISAELLSSLGKAAESTDGIGLLFCDSQTDYAAVLKKISAAVAFPIIGGTALGFPFTDDSGKEISASLLVLQKEGMTFSVAVSDPLEISSCKKQMEAVFQRCRSTFAGDPKLVLPLFALVPGFPTGLFIDEILSLAKELPVFGGTTTNDLVSTKAAVFAEGEAYSDRMILVMLGGAVEPVFATGNKVTPTVEYAPTVTGSSGNEVFRVDESSYCEYMHSIGISPEDRVNGVDALMQYGPTPVLVESPEIPETDVPLVRCISYTNVEKGSAMFSGPVSEGTRLRMSILRKEDVTDATSECLQKLQRRMAPAEAAGYVYTTLLCISCVARYFVFTGSANAERELLMRDKPQGLAPAGFYAFCEIGPTFTKNSTAMVNRAHSASLAICAI